MSGTPTRSIALTATLETFTQARVASGRCGNASAVVGAGLRLLEREEARLHRAAITSLRAR